MHKPGLLERVRLNGFDEVYLVTRVDHETQVADLWPIVYGRVPVYQASFERIEAIPGVEPPKLRPD